MTASGASVSDMDNLASNGVVHVVNSILYPPPRATIQETLHVGQEFGLAYSFIQRCSFFDMYKGKGVVIF